MKKPLLWIVGSIILVFLMMATQILLPINYQEFFSILGVSIVIGIIIGALGSILHNFISSRNRA